MSNSKRTYINLINDFHAFRRSQPVRERASSSVCWLYSVILDHINRNRWEPVAVSDVQLAEEVGVSRNHIGKYRELLKVQGFLEYKQTKAGCKTLTVYSIPEGIAPKSADNCTQKCSSGKVNCTLKGNSNEGIAPKSADNCTQKCSSTPGAPYNISIKTSLRQSSSKTYAQARDDGDDGKGGGVKISLDEIVAERQRSQKTEGAAAALIEKRKRAAKQGKEALEAFLDESNKAVYAPLCMKHHISEEQLRRTAEGITARWVNEGTTFDTPAGEFDISGALKSLRIAIQKMSNREAQGLDSPASRSYSPNRDPAKAPTDINSQWAWLKDPIR